MPASSETPVAERQILIVGPYGVLGTGVIDAVAENPRWGITTAARRPAPTYRRNDTARPLTTTIAPTTGRGLISACSMLTIKSQESIRKSDPVGTAVTSLPSGP